MEPQRATVAQALAVMAGCVALAACDGSANGGGSTPLVDGGAGRDAGGGSSGFGAVDSGAGGRTPGTGGTGPAGGTAGVDSGPGASGGASEAGTGGTAHVDSGAGGTAHVDSGAGGTAGAGDSGTVAAGRFVCPPTLCPVGQKLCDVPGHISGFGVCVDIDDPAFGCGPTTCGPCSVHGSATCSGGACSYTACAPHFDDCDGNPVNGCETDLLAHDTCGACHTSCGASEKCDLTGCVAACPFPRSDCSGSCRDLTSDPANCGGCNNACSQVTQSGTCSAGKCACASTAEDCGSGCIDVTSNPYQCGGCGQLCPGLPTPDPPPPGGEIVCESRTCGFHCFPGFTDCSSVCTNLDADPNQCGTCGHACASGEICLNGACSTTSTTRFLEGRSKPEDIVLDAAAAYFTDLGDDTVWRVKKDGTGAKKLGSSQAKPFRIAVDDTNAYWTSNLGGAVLVAPKDGSGTAAVFASSSKPSGISLDATKVYWVSDTDHSVHQQPKSGGTDSVLASLDAGAIGPGFGNVVDMVGTATTLLICDGRNFARVDKATGKVDADLRITGTDFSPTLSLSGGFATGLSFGTRVTLGVESLGGVLLTRDFPSVFVTDGCTFYFTDGASHLARVQRGVANVDNVSVAPTIFSGGTAIRRLALDSDSLYWTDTGYVGKVAR